MRKKLNTQIQKVINYVFIFNSIDGNAMKAKVIAFTY